MRHVKVHVKSNDNNRVEEWCPVEYLLESSGVSARISQLESDNIWLVEHIGRLEQIITNMARGCETSQPENGNGHTHWVYPANGASDLIAEMRGQYIGEEPEPNGARWRDIAQREVAQHGIVTPEEIREINEPHKDAIIAAVAAERGQRGWQDCPRCGGPLPPDRWLCRECESDLAMEHAPIDAFRED